ncbi:MAG: ankyrin repeat domain-containing protein [Gammaproteobacteria bacterium]
MGQDSSKSKKPEDCKRKGDEHFQNQKYDLALKWYQDACDGAPDNLEYWRSKIVCLRMLGKFDDAYQELDGRLGVEPSDAWACNQKGLLFEAQRKDIDALNSYLIAVTLEPNNIRYKENWERMRIITKAASDIIEDEQFKDNNIDKARSSSPLFIRLKDVVTTKVASDIPEVEQFENKDVDKARPSSPASDIPEVEQFENKDVDKARPSSPASDIPEVEQFDNKDIDKAKSSSQVTLKVKDVVKQPLAPNGASVLHQLKDYVDPTDPEQANATDMAINLIDSYQVNPGLRVDTLTAAQVLKQQGLTDTANVIQEKIKNKKIVKILPSEKDWETLLCQAAWLGDEEQVRECLERKTHNLLSKIENEEEYLYAIPKAVVQDAIQKAVVQGHIAVVRLFLEKATEINKRAELLALIGDKGKTLLHYAVAGQHLKMISMLLNEQLNLDAKDALGNSVLHDAVFLGNKEIIKLLQQRNASITLTNKEGKTALQLAKEKDKALAILIESNYQARQYVPAVHEEQTPFSQLGIDWDYVFEQRLLADKYYSPISKNVIVNPVKAEDGNIYEASDIEKWFKTRQEQQQPITSPLTGVQMGLKLTPDNGLKKEIVEAVNKLPESINVRKKKLEVITAVINKDYNRLEYAEILAQNQKQIDTLFSIVKDYHSALEEKIIAGELDKARWQAESDKFAELIQHVKTQVIITPPAPVSAAAAPPPPPPVPSAALTKAKPIVKPVTTGNLIDRLKEQKINLSDDSKPLTESTGVNVQEELISRVLNPGLKPVDAKAIVKELSPEEKLKQELLKPRSLKPTHLQKPLAPRVIHLTPQQKLFQEIKERQGKAGVNIGALKKASLFAPQPNTEVATTVLQTNNTQPVLHISLALPNTSQPPVNTELEHKQEQAETEQKVDQPQTNQDVGAQENEQDKKSPKM